MSIWEAVVIGCVAGAIGGAFVGIAVTVIFARHAVGDLLGQLRGWK